MSKLSLYTNNQFTGSSPLYKLNRPSCAVIV